MICKKCDSKMKDVSKERLSDYEWWNGELWECESSECVHTVSLYYDEMR